MFFSKWQVDVCPNIPVVFGFSWWNFDVLGGCCSPSQCSTTAMKHQLNPLQAMVQICANDVIGCAKKKRDAAKKNCFRRIS